MNDFNSNNNCPYDSFPLWTSDDVGRIGAADKHEHSYSEVSSLASFELWEWEDVHDDYGERQALAGIVLESTGEHSRAYHHMLDEIKAKSSKHKDKHSTGKKVKVAKKKDERNVVGVHAKKDRVMHEKKKEKKDSSPKNRVKTTETKTKSPYNSKPYIIQDDKKTKGKKSAGHYTVNTKELTSLKQLAPLRSSSPINHLELIKDFKVPELERKDIPAKKNVKVEYRKSYASPYKQKPEKEANKSTIKKSKADGKDQACSYEQKPQKESIKSTMKNSKADRKDQASPYEQKPQESIKSTMKKGKVNGKDQASSQKPLESIKSTMKKDKVNGKDQASPCEQNPQESIKSTMKKGKVNGKDQACPQNPQESIKSTMKKGKVNGKDQASPQKPQESIKSTMKKCKEDGKDHVSAYEQNESIKSIKKKVEYATDYVSQYSKKVLAMSRQVSNKVTEKETSLSNVSLQHPTSKSTLGVVLPKATTTDAEQRKVATNKKVSNVQLRNESLMKRNPVEKLKVSTFCYHASKRTKAKEDDGVTEEIDSIIRFDAEHVTDVPYLSPPWRCMKPQEAKTHTPIIMDRKAPEPKSMPSRVRPTRPSTIGTSTALSSKDVPSSHISPPTGMTSATRPSTALPPKAKLPAERPLTDRTSPMKPLTTVKHGSTTTLSVAQPAPKHSVSLNRSTKRSNDAR